MYFPYGHVLANLRVTWFYDSQVRVHGVEVGVQN